MNGERREEDFWLVDESRWSDPCLMVSQKINSTLWASLLLAGLVVLAFGGALRCGFVHFDDPLYVFENVQVSKGLTPDGIRWAFTTGHAANWHPLTWLSHMADVDLYGLAPAGHHATSLLLHALNAILLFSVLRGMTGRFFLSWLVAALWAVHPLRAESVVWISERKDVLAIFFGLWALEAYRRTDLRGRMGWVALAFALSLMSKPLWVTLPFLLLLLDVWPLQRWPGISIWKLAREKWPIFLLAAASCGVTYLVQQAGGAVRPFEQFSFGTRLGNSAVAYGQYLRMLFWPFQLSFFYPHPGEFLSTGRIMGSVAGLLALSGLAMGCARRRPWWTVGWLWYLGALVPMIGLVQVGGQAWADRYSYLPHIGLLVALAWGAAESAEAMRVRHLSTAWAVLAAGWVLGLAILARQQTQVWRDSETLFRHALAIEENNALAHGNLGSWYALEGRTEEAMEHLQRSVEIQPRKNEAIFNLGNLYLELGNQGEAIRQYRAMVAENPRHVLALNNLAWLLATQPGATREQSEEALALAQRAVECAEGPSAVLQDTVVKAREAVAAHSGRSE